MYRKFSADNIFNGYQLLGAGNILITDNKGTVIDIVTAGEAGDEIQNFNGILTPGFINAHCHLELSHMKGCIPENTGLVDFVYKVISERHFSEEEIFCAIEKADTEMYNSGIVAVGDICNNTYTILQKQKSRLQYHNFIETTGFNPFAANDSFERSFNIYTQFKKSFAHTYIVPHAPYSVSPEMFAMIDAFPNNKVLTIHNQEAAAENELFVKGKGDFLKLYEQLNIDITFFKPSGKTSLQTYLPYLKNYRSLLLVHNVYTSKEDISFQKQFSTLNPQLSTYYCLCPNANLYINNTLPNVPLLQNECCDIVLGTDSLASNYQLNILEEMKTLQQHFPSLSTATLLQWATSNGAKALQLDHTLGSFEKGKQPGVVLINTTPEGSFSKESLSSRII